MPNTHDVLARHLNLLRKCGNKSFVLLLAHRSTAINRLVGKWGPVTRVLMTLTRMGSMHMPRRRAHSRISTPTARHLRAAVASAT